MNRAVLSFAGDQYRMLLEHLLPGGFAPEVERGAFVFARATTSDASVIFSAVDQHLLGPDDFSYQSDVHLELADAARAVVIKRAHDLGCSLVEFHCHLGQWPPQFSPSDLAGFEEFVPHVWWRLRGRPYMAVVVAETGFDALAWIKDGSSAEPVAVLEVADRKLRPSGLTWQRLQGGSRWID